MEIYVVTIVDGSDFDKTLDKKAFRDRFKAGQWEEQRIEYWKASYQEDGLDPVFQYSIRGYVETIDYEG